MRNSFYSQADKENWELVKLSEGNIEAVKPFVDNRRREREEELGKGRE